jgi:hypothetical protein
MTELNGVAHHLRHVQALSLLLQRPVHLIDMQAVPASFGIPQPDAVVTTPALHSKAALAVEAYPIHIAVMDTPFHPSWSGRTGREATR